MRSASAALPRIKPHWSHRSAAGAEWLSCICATAPAPHMHSFLVARGTNCLTSFCIPLHSYECRYMKILLVGESGKHCLLRLSSWTQLLDVAACITPCLARRHASLRTAHAVPSQLRPALPQPGLGKTTFIRNLFAAYARDASFPINDASGPNAKRVGGC